MPRSECVVKVLWGFSFALMEILLNELVESFAHQLQFCIFEIM